MSYSQDLALDRPREMNIAAAEIPLDLAAVHCFRFLSQRWFAGVSSLTKGLLMLLVGIFLFSQIPSTPNLVVQMMIIATLLTVCGLVFSWLAWREFSGSFTIDQQGFQARFGLNSFSGNWSQVTNWDVSDSGHSADLPAVQIWTDKDDTLHSIPGGFIPPAEQLHVRQLLRSFAPPRYAGKFQS